MGHEATYAPQHAMPLFDRFTIPLAQMADAANRYPLSNIFLPSLISIGPSLMSAQRLRVEKRAEHSGPASLEILLLLQSTLQQSFDSLLRFRPRKCRLKRV
jgi:hypothetical protein